MSRRTVDRAASARERALLREAQPSFARFAPGLLAGAGTALSTVALLAASAWLIARAAEQPGLAALAAVLVAVRAFALGRGSFRYLERLWGHDAALGELARVRERLVRRLLPLAPDGLGRTRRGALLTNLVDDVDELQNLPLRVIMPLGVAALAAVAAVVFASFLSPIAAVVLAGCLVAAFAVAVGLGWIAGARAERAIAPLRGRLADTLLDEITALDVLTAYDAVDVASVRVHQADRALRDATVRRAAAQGLATATVSVAAAAACLLGLWLAAPGIGAGGFSGPALAVVVLLPLAVFEIFGPVPLALASWRQVRAAAGRVVATVPAEPPAEIASDALAPAGVAVPLGDGIVLTDVSAHWPAQEGEPESDGALRDAHLVIRPGQRLLLSGRSGSGKTTLAHVLVRFLDYRGSYRIGGVEARDVSAADLRLTVGLVEQQAFLFDDDLRQNLLFARDTASDDDLLAVLARVGLAEWTAARGGLDSPLGEHGALVSGGQAQRIALARALLAEFPVLVLDEPSAGVDPAASDALLRDLLTAVPADRAVVLISHVDVPADLLDRRFVLDAGRIAPA